MNTRSTVVAAALLTAAAVPTWGQTASPSAGPNGGAHDTASTPDFSGLWARVSFPGFAPPGTGAGPVTNKKRSPNGAASIYGYVGDYTNPILKPQAAEIVKKHGEIELGGAHAANPRTECWPEGVPLIFTNVGMQMLQQPDKITFLYSDTYEIRRVRMNQPHPVDVTPSWYGDSVGRYEGDTLVIDTVGVKIGPFAMVDLYGTPHSPALHVVERYRLLDYEAAKEALERNAKENLDFGRGPGDAPLRVDPNYRGKHLQLAFTVEDEGVFTTSWTATITYRPGFNWRGVAEWQEVVCADNILSPDGKDEAVPHADKSDF